MGALATLIPRQTMTQLSFLLLSTLANGESQSHCISPPESLKLTVHYSIQHLVQFDSDHVLDVHQARLYPFDTYFITTTLRAVNFSNQTIPIEKIAAIDQTSNFCLDVSDLDSYSSITGGAQSSSRDADFRASRPGQARAFTLLLFAVSWMLTHVCMGCVALDWYTVAAKSSLIKHLIISFAILLIHPQLRESMPDAPGYDGKRLWCIM